MDWELYLENGESIRWEGKPAPRCYTFRNWKHSLFGMLLTLFATWWQVFAIQLSAVYDFPYLVWIPVPFWLGGFYLAFGHLVVARLEWDNVGYLVTDRRILVKRGVRKLILEQVSLEKVCYFRLHRYAEELGTVRVYTPDGSPPLKLLCLEYPRRLTSLLEEEMSARGLLAGKLEAGESD